MVRQQISISISPGLHRRLEEYRESINISEICRRALTDKLDEIESRKKGKKHMTLVARLQEEKRLVTDQTYSQGQAQLDKDLSEMPYVTIKKLIARDFSMVLVRAGSKAAAELFWKVKSLADPSTKWEKTERGQKSVTRETTWPSFAEEIERTNFIKGYLDRLEERWNTELKAQIEG